MNDLKTLQKVAVIGAGVMGAGIAAQAANGGAEVLLLDIVPTNCRATDRNEIAQDALDRLLKAGTSGGLMHPCVAERIQVGNTEDNFAQLAEYDWIIEVIVEQLAIKQDLYRRLNEVRRADTIISSNTSTIPLAKLIEGLPQNFCQHFVITHYFNPPRHMRLVEIIAGEQTLPNVVTQVSRFNDQKMGKTIIHCADRPGFIGNRLGVFWLQVALQEAINLNLTIETADAIMSICGFPRTGVFGLWDLVGIDLMPTVTESLSRLLPDNDDFVAYATLTTTVKNMLDKGYYGRKGKIRQGFYRQTKNDNGNYIKEVIDLDTLTYRALQKPHLASTQLKPGQLTELLASDDKGGQYAWRVLSQILHYATKLIPEVATEVNAVDQVMKLGYNWRWGPFEMIDKIGLAPLTKRLEKEGIKLSSFIQNAANRPVYRYQDQHLTTLDATGDYHQTVKAKGILSLTDIKRQGAIETYTQSTVWDLGNDVWCMEFTSNLPTLNSELLEQISTTLTLATAQQKALIFYNEGPVFATGADLKELLSLIDKPEQLRAFINKGQQLFHALQTASIPTVGALSGKALGGGLELLLHCQSIQAHAEISVGLVENLVGIVPGWGGCKELLLRSVERFGAERAISHSFDLIRNSKVTASAIEARQLGFLRDSDGISMSLDRLLFDAKQKALTLRSAPPVQQAPVPSLPVTDEIKLSLDGYQAHLDNTLLMLLSQAQSNNWYHRFFEYEHDTNQKLCQYPETRARIEHLLEAGQPLIN